MTMLSVVVKDFLPAVTPSPQALASSSRLSQIIVAAHIAALRQWTTPTFEVVDYLPVPSDLHRLAEFPAYRSAKISRTIKSQDEPLFALDDACQRRFWDYVLRPVVEHSVFGCGGAIHRKRLSDGAWVIVVAYGKRKRALLMTSPKWVTPIEKLLRIKARPVKVFSFSDGSPDKMDRGGSYYRWVPFVSGNRIPLNELLCFRPVEPHFGTALDLDDYAKRAEQQRSIREEIAAWLLRERIEQRTLLAQAKIAADLRAAKRQAEQERFSKTIASLDLSEHLDLLIKEERKKEWKKCGAPLVNPCCVTAQDIAEFKSDTRIQKQPKESTCQQHK